MTRALIRAAVPLASMDVARRFPMAAAPLRHFREISAAYGDGKILQKVCPWYAIPERFKGPEFVSLNNFRASLALKLTPLIAGDGFHRGVANIENGLDGRSAVISRYHQAMLEAEEKLASREINPHKKALDDKIEVTCVNTENEKAKGCAVLVTLPDCRRVVGRMFIAQSTDDIHLTNLSTHEPKALTERQIDAEDVGRQMLKSYFEDRNLSERGFDELMTGVVKKSCIGYYDMLILRIAQKYGLLPLDNDGGYPLSGMIRYSPRSEDDRDFGGHIGNIEAAGVEMSFSMRYLALLAGVEKYVVKPSAGVAPSQRGVQKLVTGVESRGSEV